MIIRAGTRPDGSSEDKNMTATQGLLMFTTVFAAVMGNFCKNTFCKGMLKNQSDNLCFNLVGNVFVLVVVTLLGGASAVALTTFCYGAGMGIFNLLAALLFALALSCGPMSLTTLIQLGISLVVSALLGPVFWHEPITAYQAVGILLLLIAIVLTSNTKVDKNISVKWLVLTILAGAFNATLGLFQKLQNMSPHPEEQMGFLFWCFIFSTGLNIIWLTLRTKTGKKETVTFQLKGKVLLFALLCGVSMAAQHIINLKMVGALPTAVFFPLCSGSRILCTALLGIFWFKEKLSRRQLIGFIIGFAALMLIAGVFG